MTRALCSRTVNGRRCSRPLRSGDTAYVVDTPYSVIALDGTIKRRGIDPRLWCQPCGEAA